MSDIIDLTIDKLAGLGDGVGVFEGHRIFVPYTLAGDKVKARVTRRTKDADYAELEAVETPGPGRIVPVCKHFGICGGCSLQHMNDALYNDFKQQSAREAVRKAGFDPNLTEPMVRIPAASRRRVELKVESGKLGYYAERTHRLINIEECKVLEPELEALVLSLKPMLAKLLGLASVQINGVDNGYDIVLGGSGSKKWNFAGADDVLRVSTSEDGVIRTLFETVPVTLRLGDVQVEVPPGAFMQASVQAQSIMTARVVESVGAAEKVLDLFAGLGTYSFPLSARSEVTAIEGDGPMVDAMRRAAANNGRTMRIDRRDLFKKPVKARELALYDAVVINPPRSGALAQSAELASAKVKKLIMVSCNPATFTRDARVLMDAGYNLQKALPIDQFTYSSHLEIIAEFAF